MLDALDSSPHKDNTIVILWFDHGYHLGGKNTFQKQSLWECSSHVPLVISVPGIKAGQRCDRVVGLLDLYPTLLDLCGIPPNSRNEGRSFGPLLKDPMRPWPYVAITGWQEESFAVQNERYRYMLW